MKNIKLRSELKPFRAFTSRSTNEKRNSMVVGPRTLSAKAEENWVTCPLCGKTLQYLLGTHCGMTHNMTKKQYLAETGMHPFQCSTEEFREKHRKTANRLIKSGKININLLSESGKKNLRKFQSRMKTKEDWSKQNSAGRVKSHELWKERREWKSCVNCDKSFSAADVTQPFKEAIYCSAKCYHSHRVTLKCSECGKDYTISPRTRKSTCNKCYNSLWKRQWFRSLPKEERERRLTSLRSHSKL